MKLVDLIKIIKDYNDLKEISCNLFLNSETEVNIIYMESQIDFDSEICFFTLEETNDNLFYKKENILYIQLFPLPDLIDLVIDDFAMNENINYSNLELAEKIIEYRKNDA